MEERTSELKHPVQALHCGQLCDSCWVQGALCLQNGSCPPGTGRVRCLYLRAGAPQGLGGNPSGIASDMQQHECAMSWKAHCGEVYSVAFSYDENTVYSVGEDGKVSGSWLWSGSSLPLA